MIMETREQRQARVIQQKKSDAEYLRNCLERTSKQVGLLSPNLWYSSNDTLLSVATILEGECLFTASDAIRFFEKPYHFEKEMAELADELEQDANEQRTED